MSPRSTARERWVARALRCALLGAPIAGCSSSPNAKAPEVSLPAAYEGQRERRPVVPVDWRTYFADEQLVSLIRTALDGNFDVRMALQRIEVVRASLNGATGARLPQVGLAAGASVQKFGRYHMDGAGNASTDITPGQRVPVHYPDLSVGLVASWEPDLWGRLGSLRDSARAQYLASIEGTHLVLSTLVADVAVTYYELAAADQRRRILGQTLRRRAQALAVMRLQKEAGQATELAVAQFEGELASTRAAMLAEEQRATELENDMNLLLGRTPRPIARDAKALERPSGASLTAGVPSDLLRNRPDLREAELMLRASEADVEAADAAFYPSLTITAGLGYRAFSPEYLFATPDSLVYSLAGGLFAPLFNRSALDAALDGAKAARLHALYGYRSTVLRAFVEVSSALAAVERAGRVVVERSSRRDTASRTAELADALFGAGRASYLEVLLVQQAVLEAELELVDARLEQRLAAVRLYKALGGGWQPGLGEAESRPK